MLESLTQTEIGMERRVDMQRVAECGVIYYISS